MHELLLTVTLVGNLQITAYRSVKSATDDSPYYTSIGERTNVHGAAVSQDLLIRWGGSLKYGDQLYIDGVGWRVVNDTMHPRMKQHIDVWCENLDQERQFHHKWKGKKTQVWVIRRSE